jgi:hypothetical protein
MNLYFHRRAYTQNRRLVTSLKPVNCDTVGEGTNTERDDQQKRS